jgi:hypothetical protein
VEMLLKVIFNPRNVNLNDENIILVYKLNNNNV